MDNETGSIPPAIMESFTKSEKSDNVKTIWPSRIEFWCNLCTKNYTVSRKKENGEFDEQLVCQHMVLKKVVK